ncbi:MAG: glutathione peroxidase [Clostridia bacterium]|nr:glutathione peroxidase [Clostridia bacterium]
MTIYDIKAKNAKGEEVSLSDYKGKVLLIVNTATGCGFTPQYKGLEELYKKYNAQGFEILDFPCNQFGAQAPGTEEEIVSFCTLNYGVTFPQFAKIEVNGENEHPLYKYLKSQKGGLLGNKIKWNFTKFLLDKSGHVIDRFAPNIEPAKIENRIKELL